LVGWRARVGRVTSLDEGLKSQAFGKVATPLMIRRESALVNGGPDDRGERGGGDDGQRAGTEASPGSCQNREQAQSELNDDEPRRADLVTDSAS
jgi:hypothetical protein